MDIKELLEEDAFDPQKLFNEEEYSTLILDREGFTKKENQVADLVMQLLDKEVTREEAEAVFSRLKELNATQLLPKKPNWWPPAGKRDLISQKNYFFLRNCFVSLILNWPSKQ